MQCPKCKIGTLSLYKETESVYRYKLTRENKIYKKPYTSSEHPTDKEYLECGNDECYIMWDFDVNEQGKVIKDSLTIR